MNSWESFINSNTFDGSYSGRSGHERNIIFLRANLTKQYMLLLMLNTCDAYNIL